MQETSWKMAEKDIQVQIDEINLKLDAILECATAQKLRTERMDDLMDDVNIIARDAFRNSVEELEKQGVELNWDDIRFLGFKLLKNVDKFTYVMDTFESLYDLMQDLGPVAREVIIDMIKKMHQLEQKGYFEFFGAMTNVIDNIISNYSKEDMENIPEYSMWKAMKEMRTPEMKRVIGFLITFLKNLSKENVVSLNQ